MPRRLPSVKDGAMGIEQAAKFTGMSKWFILKMIYAKPPGIITTQVGRRRLVPKSECERILREGIGKGFGRKVTHNGKKL